MPDFQGILASQPEKYFRRTDVPTAKRLQECFSQLEINPLFSFGKVKKIQGQDTLFRYRVGSLRVVYEVDFQNQRVHVVAIFPRGDIYKKI